MINKVALLKGLVFFVLLLLLTPVTLALSFYGLSVAKADQIAYEQQVLAYQANTDLPPYGANLYAALPEDSPTIDASIKESDARVDIVKGYLSRYNSPLVELSDYIVKVADENEMDFRLIVAIAQQESNLCKRIPPESYNCWGWGIHSRGTLGFESYEQGIRVVSEGVKREYLNKGLTTPFEIMSKYTPLSNGSWARGVELFMAEME